MTSRPDQCLRRARRSGLCVIAGTAQRIKHRTHKQAVDTDAVGTCEIPELLRNRFQCLKQLFSKHLCECRPSRRSKRLTVLQPAFAKKIPALRRACVSSSKQLSGVHRMTSAKLFQSWTANHSMRILGSGQEAAEASPESCR